MLLFISVIRTCKLRTVTVNLQIVYTTFFFMYILDTITINPAVLIKYAEFYTRNMFMFCNSFIHWSKSSK